MQAVNQVSSRFRFVLWAFVAGCLIGCAGPPQDVAARVVGDWRMNLTEERRRAVPEGVPVPSFLLTLRENGTFELRSQRDGLPDEVASGGYTVTGNSVIATITMIDGSPAVGPERETLTFRPESRFQALRQSEGSRWVRVGSVR